MLDTLEISQISKEQNPVYLSPVILFTNMLEHVF